MIYVDINCFNLNKKIDAKFDEDIFVCELIEEMEGYFPINKDCIQVISKRNRKILSKNNSFKEQGILGGDTLILVESGV